jgi:hypothetical protein
MPIGHAVLGAWERCDVDDPLDGLHALLEKL